MSKTSNGSESPHDLTPDGSIHELSFYGEQPSIYCTGSTHGPTAPSGTNAESFQTENEGAKVNGSAQSMQGDGGDSICGDFTASSVSSSGSALLALTRVQDPFDLLASCIFAPDSLYLSDQTAEEIWESWKALVEDIHKEYDVFRSEGKAEEYFVTSMEHFGLQITVMLKRQQRRSTLCFKLEFDNNRRLVASPLLGPPSRYNWLHGRVFRHRLSEAGNRPESAKEALETISVSMRDTFSTSKTGYSGWLLCQLVSHPSSKQEMRSYLYYGVIDSRTPQADCPIVTCQVTASI